MARVTLSIQPADSLSHSCCLRSPTGTFTVIWPWLGCVISLSVSVKRASVLMGGNESARTRGPSIGPFFTGQRSRGGGGGFASGRCPVERDCRWRPGQSDGVVVVSSAVHCERATGMSCPRCRTIPRIES